MAPVNKAKAEASKSVGSKSSAAAVKAKKTAGSLKKGSGRKAHNIHTKVHFFKPHTNRLARAPKFSRKSTVNSQTALSKAHDVITYPLTTESAMKQIEANNTLVFIVALTANKAEIKRAVKKMYEIDAEKINTLIRPDGLKKAYVKLTKDFEALDVANKLGMI